MQNLYLFPKKCNVLLTAFAAGILIFFSQHLTLAQQPGFKASINKFIQGATNTNARIASNNSLPQNSDDFMRFNGSWNLAFKSKYRYDSAGNLTSRIKMNAAGTQKQYNDSSTYDLQGNENFFGNFEWLNNAWNIRVGHKNLRTYNIAGKETENIIQRISAGVWGNDSRRTTTYNTAGNPLVITDYKWVNNAWQLAYRSTYTYPNPANPPTEITYESYYNGTWFNRERLINVVWHNWAAFQMSSFIRQAGFNNVWWDINKVNYSYNPNGGFIMIEQKWVNNNWVNEYRWTKTYDNQLNYNGDRLEKWQNNAWAMDFESQEVLTYNALNDVTERMFSGWDSASNMMEDYIREVYSNFIRITGKVKDLPALKINVYPNPADTYLTINLENTAEVQVQNLTGCVIKTVKLPAGLNKIDIFGLPTGLYLLNIQTEKGNFKTKVVKQ